MTTHRDVIEAIDEFFGDTNRTPEETLDGLDQIAEHAGGLADMLSEEIRERMRHD